FYFRYIHYLKGFYCCLQPSHLTLSMIIALPGNLSRFVSTGNGQVPPHTPWPRRRMRITTRVGVGATAALALGRGATAFHSGNEINAFQGVRFSRGGPSRRTFPTAAGDQGRRPGAGGGEPGAGTARKGW
ncbi:unnamed protein product, partial [Discosporangium mesarthrocarpum]